MAQLHWARPCVRFSQRYVNCFVRGSVESLKILYLVSWIENIDSISNLFRVLPMDQKPFCLKEKCNKKKPDLTTLVSCRADVSHTTDAITLNSANSHDSTGKCTAGAQDSRPPTVHYYHHNTLHTATWEQEASSHCCASWGWPWSSPRPQPSQQPASQAWPRAGWTRVKRQSGGNSLAVFLWPSLN